MTWIEWWERQDTPWDAGAPAPALVDLVRGGDVPAGRALVPGCGAGWDVLALTAPDRFALGVDLAPGAAQRFRHLRTAAGLDATRADLHVADFFAWEPTAPFDFAWDYTFLCALPPAMRERWAERMADVLAPEGLLGTLVFPILPGADPSKGPPYPMRLELVRGLLAARFDLLRAERPARSHPGREGKELLALWRKKRS